jgi:hypothetical protein
MRNHIYAVFSLNQLVVKVVGANETEKENLEKNLQGGTDTIEVTGADDVLAYLKNSPNRIRVSSFILKCDERVSQDFSVDADEQQISEEIERLMH